MYVLSGKKKSIINRRVDNDVAIDAVKLTLHILSRGYTTWIKKKFFYVFVGFLSFLLSYLFLNKDEQLM
jgi:hypothetical protein